MTRFLVTCWLKRCLSMFIFWNAMAICFRSFCNGLNKCNLQGIIFWCKIFMLINQLIGMLLSHLMVIQPIFMCPQLSLFSHLFFIPLIKLQITDHLVQASSKSIFFLFCYFLMSHHILLKLLSVLCNCFSLIFFGKSFQLCKLTLYFGRQFLVKVSRMVTDI